MLEPIVIPDGDVSPAHAHTLPEKYQGELSSVMIPYARIFERVHDLAASIARDYAGGDVHVLSVMDGADMFCTDLLYWLGESKSSVTRQDIRAKSYVGAQSSGDVNVTGDLASVKGKNVLVVEDIIDTGLTMDKLTGLLEKLGAADVKVASLLLKRTPHSNGFVPDYAGFSVPDDFVIGYGMDYNERFRDLLHIGVIHPDAVEKYRDAS